MSKKKKSMEEVGEELITEKFGEPLDLLNVDTVKTEELKAHVASLSGSAAFGTDKAICARKDEEPLAYEKDLKNFINHTETRLHSIREYLKTVKVDGRKLFGDEDLDEAFGKSFLNG